MNGDLAATPARRQAYLPVNSSGAFTEQRGYHRSADRSHLPRCRSDLCRYPPGQVGEEATAARRDESLSAAGSEVFEDGVRIVGLIRTERVGLQVLRQGQRLGLWPA